MTEKQEKNIKTAFVTIKKFCDKNGFKMPKVVIHDTKSKDGNCGYHIFNSNSIVIYVKSCANVAENPGFSWSHPHYFVDRTVYGVILHEFGHYIHDKLNNPKLPAGRRITSYEPNMNERFAETMKIFLSNPDLLKHYNQKRYDALIKLGLKPVITTDWITTLGKDINPKYIEACKKRINVS